MKKRTLWIGVGGVAVIAAGAIALPLLDHGVPVETATAGRQHLQEVISDEGRTRARNAYVVSAPVTGQLQRIELDEGDSVEAGAVVARLLPPPDTPRTARVAEAQVAAAEARRDQAAALVEGAVAESNQAEREAKRSASLGDSLIVSNEAVERTRLVFRAAQQKVVAAQATLRAAEADLAAAQASLGQIEQDSSTGDVVDVRAVQAGSVLSVFERNLRVVQAGTPLIEIGDTANLEVVVSVLSEDAVRIRAGNTLLVADWGGDETLEGEVVRVEPHAFTETSTLGVQEQRVNVIGRLTGAPENLGSGYRVEASVVIWEGDDVLVVPASAIFQVRGEWHLFAVAGGKAVLRKLTVGHRSPDLIEIIDGVSEGEPVILFPPQDVKDGIEVDTRG